MGWRQVALIGPEALETEALGYRIFGLGRDQEPWRAERLIREFGVTPADDERAELAWRVASRGYYAEQAGLVAAATLAAATDDAPLRLAFATAVGDEARHADAFYQYARTLDRELEPCAELLEPLDRTLTELPHMGRMLVHTILEGAAADEFLLLEKVFSGDSLGRIYHHVRRDEVRHVAIGLNYLGRATRTPGGREEFEAHGEQWHRTGFALCSLEPISRFFGPLVGRDAEAVERWFVRRHRARLKAARLHAITVEATEGGEST
ncbi:ferritin-like domain-containing protein [Kitasatospora sp. NPDC001539]|uniref:ferritin-like domain-containing protein n=1 Tax=Kitasatospora sp. NPDC001539 TaxID=3154384 RepID=UPI00331758E2